MSKDLMKVEGGYASMLEESLANFNGQPEMVNEMIKNLAGKRHISITITNSEGTPAVDQEVYLCPSMMVGESENGHLLSGKSIGGTPLTITSPNGATSTDALKALFRYFDENPSALLGIRISATSELQMNKSITYISQINPFLKTYPSEVIQIEGFIDSSIDTGRVALVRRLLTFDRESQIILTVAPGTVNLTLYFDDAANVAQLNRGQLAKKFKG